ncbi:MAG: gnd, 6-phosphogluconate dehydrogenase, 6-phosphogluconate dehydrogenase, partial [Candidatus Rokubacteria bacterium CSP1-6]
MRRWLAVGVGLAALLGSWTVA